MKKMLHWTIITFPLFTLWFCTSSSGMKNKERCLGAQVKTVDTGKGVAVLELFTSQGCSSCPPADRLIETYTSKGNVIVLSFHVDYWDRMGWKDPYSSKKFTQRQYDYASALHSNVYTPQLVINGQTEMIGSDSAKIDATLQKVFAENADAMLSIKSATPANGKLSLAFEVSGKTGNAIVNIAVVEKKTTTEIKAGENGGVTLSGNNVVRNFATMNQYKTGGNTATLDIPGNMDLKNSSVIIYLQQKKTNKIIAATQQSL